MKNGITFVLVLMVASVAVYHLACPSENEKQVAQWHRQAREEKEQITKEILSLRNDINSKLSEFNVREIEDGVDDLAIKSGRDLESLRTKLENENRELRQSVKEVEKLTASRWNSIKYHTEKQISEVRRDFVRVQRRMEQAMR